MPKVEGKDRLNRKFYITATIFIACAVLLLILLLAGAYGFVISLIGLR